MKEFKFADELYKRVIKYFDFTWSKHSGVDIMSLFSDLPFRLVVGGGTLIILLFKFV